MTKVAFLVHSQALLCCVLKEVGFKLDKGHSGHQEAGHVMLVLQL